MRDDTSSCSTMDPPEQLRIYMPHCVLNSPSGCCYGRWLPDNDLIFITAIGKSQQHCELIPGIYWDNESPPGPVKDTDSYTSEEIKFDGTGLVLVQRTCSGLPTCHWKNSMCKPGSSSLTQNVIVILYDECNIHCEGVIGGSVTENNAWKQYSLSSVPLLDVELLAGHLMQLHSVDTSSRSGSYRFRGFVSRCLMLLRRPLWMMLEILIWIFSWAELLVSVMPGWVPRLLSVSTVCVQLAVKGEQLKSMSSRSATHKTVGNQNRYANTLLILLADLVLGSLVCYLSERYLLHQALSTRIVFHLKSTGVQLEDLLHRLMGIPAGLKLNSGFAHFLGHFFLYQCYLWIGYLHMLYPLMDATMRALSFSGCLGLTVLLAAACDVISLLTFHIYCFYVYAAKIFTLQLSALGSLSRLFRGRKWNVLRNRVDSCSYDMDQLFIGTLIFTVLLFLLPTTLLFYAVFTLLQLVVLIFKGLFRVAIHHLRIFPWFTLIRWVLGGSEFRSEPSFVKLNNGDPGETTHLCMQLKMMPLSRAISLTRRDLEKKASVTWSDLVKNLLQGTVIYPWRKLGKEDGV